MNHFRRQGTVLLFPKEKDDFQEQLTTWWGTHYALPAIFPDYNNHVIAKPVRRLVVAIRSLDENSLASQHLVEADCHGPAVLAIIAQGTVLQ